MSDHVQGYEHALFRALHSRTTEGSPAGGRAGRCGRDRAYLGCLLTAPLASSASLLTPSSCLKI